MRTLILIRTGKDNSSPLTEEQFHYPHKTDYTGSDDDAREWCICHTAEQMKKGYNVVTVHNIFDKEWQLRAYRELADRYQYKIHEIQLEGVPFASPSATSRPHDGLPKT